MNKLVLDIIDRQDVREALLLMLTNSSQRVLADESVVAQSREFVTDVMGDDRLQREGGYAIWQVVLAQY